MMALQSNSVVRLAFLLATLVMLIRAQDLMPGEIGFGGSVYSVEESMASVEVCVIASSTVTQNRAVNVSISTMDGTAVAMSDYIPVINHQLTFTLAMISDITNRDNCINISIINDDIHEPEEYFSVLLRGVNKTITVNITDDDDATTQTTESSTIMLSTMQTIAQATESSTIALSTVQTIEPSTTQFITTQTASIQPTVSPDPTPPQVEFSFSEEVYSTVESDGSVEVCAQASPGPIIDTITLILNGQENTATRMIDYRVPLLEECTLEFGNGRNLTQCRMITIIDDDKPELTETFTITLRIMVDPSGSAAPPGTVIATAVVSIEDDDYLECAEDIYIITEDTTELTVCVVPVSECVQTNCTDVTVSLETTQISAIFIKDANCATINFNSPIKSEEFSVNFDIFGNSSDNTVATCRVRVISPSEVPKLIFEHELYYVQESESLELCGFLVDETGEFEPAESLMVTFNTSNGDTVNPLTLTISTSNVDSEIKYCGSAVIIRDNNQPERVRYLTIELSGPKLNVPGIQPLSGFSEVIVTDDDGPSVECDDLPGILTGQNCFQELGGDVVNAVINCYSEGETDCTLWRYPEYEFILENSQTLPNYLPSLCPQSLQSELFQPLYPMRPIPECSARCIAYTQTDPLSCPGYILLMNQVFAPIALELNGTELLLENCQFGQNITLQIICCNGPESSIPNTCTAVTPSANTPAPPALPSADPPFPQEAIIGSAVGGALVLILSVLVIILAAILCCRRYKRTEKPNAAVEDSAIALENPSYHPVFELGPGDLETQQRENGNVDRYTKWRQAFASMIVSPSQLKTQEILGEGAFGQVHKGTLTSSQSDVSTQVAIKSLRDSPTEKEIDNFITESAIMLDFSHPNVMRLVGVCFDTEDGLPLIVLPYMANGDLKTFLRTKRLRNDGGTSTGSVDQFPPGLTDVILIGMCLDIVKGMEYLSRSKFVHRDLAARNCMVDEKLQVCVADFGLSKDVYNSEYYRLTHAAPLPVKWMAPESLYDNVYNEKTDVWSFGVVCWEVFSLGRVPFPGVDNADIPDYISRGHRLRQPSLCPNEINTLMQSTWEESPEERPTFLQLVYSLANVLGQDITHEYFVLEGPQRETVEPEYATVTLSNKSTSQPDGTNVSGSLGLTSSIHEVPVPSTPKHTASLASTTHDAPEYATVLSQGDTESPELHNREAAASSHVSNQTDPHIYHVLEQHII